MCNAKWEASERKLASFFPREIKLFSLLASQSHIPSLDCVGGEKLPQRAVQMQGQMVSWGVPTSNFASAMNLLCCNIGKPQNSQSLYLFLHRRGNSGFPDRVVERITCMSN